MPHTRSTSHIHARVRAALAELRLTLLVNNLRVKSYYLTCLTATTTILLAVLAHAAEALPDKLEIQARNALRDRGVTDPEQLLQHATPARILAACRRWDAQRADGRKLSPGWLAKVVRNGGIDEEKADQSVVDKRAALHHRFEQLTRQFPPGTATESHARLLARRWPDENACGGLMVVVARDFPALTVRCDVCGSETSYPLRALAGLEKPTEEHKSVGLTIEGVGTPLLSTPVTPGPDRQLTLPAFDLSESPFADTALPPDQARADAATYLAMFQLAADTLDEHQEAWAYNRMASAYFRLAGEPADDERRGLPAGMWEAMQWAARTCNAPSSDLPSSRSLSRHPRIPPVQPQSQEESLVHSH